MLGIQIPAALCKCFIWLLVFGIKPNYVCTNTKVSCHIVYYISKGKSTLSLDTGELHVMVVSGFNIGTQFI